MEQFVKIVGELLSNSRFTDKAMEEEKGEGQKQKKQKKKRA